MGRLRLLLAIAAIAVLAALMTTLAVTRWSATNAVRSPTPNPTPATLTLTEKDNGSTQEATRGTTIVVQLRGVANFRWTVPTTSDGQVVRLIGGSQNGDGSATARFLAAEPGQAFLAAIDNPDCFPICALPPAGGWRVTIVVK